MACASCEKRRQQMKAAMVAIATHPLTLLRKRKAGKANEPAPVPAAQATKRTRKAAKGARAEQAEDPSASHRKRGVAPAARESADPRPLDMPAVQDDLQQEG